MSVSGEGEATHVELPSRTRSTDVTGRSCGHADNLLTSRPPDNFGALGVLCRMVLLPGQVLIPSVRPCLTGSGRDPRNRCRCRNDRRCEIDGKRPRVSFPTELRRAAISPRVVRLGGQFYVLRRLGGPGAGLGECARVVASSGHFVLTDLFCRCSLLPCLSLAASRIRAGSGRGPAATTGVLNSSY